MPRNMLIEINQPYVNVIIVMNKKWVEALPPDLQKILHDDAAAVSKEIVPFVNDFFAGQRKAWTDKGGELISLPADEQAEMIAKISSIGNDTFERQARAEQGGQTGRRVGRAQQIAVGSSRSRLRFFRRLCFAA